MCRIAWGFKTASPFCSLFQITTGIIPQFALLVKHFSKINLFSPKNSKRLKKVATKSRATLNIKLGYRHYLFAFLGQNAIHCRLGCFNRGISFRRFFNIFCIYFGNVVVNYFILTILITN